MAFFLKCVCHQNGILEKIFLTLTRTQNRRTAICFRLILKLPSLFINHCITQKMLILPLCLPRHPDKLRICSVCSGCLTVTAQEAMFSHNTSFEVSWHCLIRTRFLASYTKLPKSIPYFLLAEQILAHASTLSTFQVPGFRDLCSSDITAFGHELGKDSVEKSEHKIWGGIGKGESYFWARSFCISVVKKRIQGNLAFCSVQNVCLTHNTPEISKLNCC